MYRFMVIGYTLPLTTVQARAIVSVAVGASGKDILTVMDLNNRRGTVYSSGCARVVYDTLCYRGGRGDQPI